VVAPIVLWMWVAGVILLCLGVAVAWSRLAAAPGLEKLIVLGQAFVASALAAFGAEHLTAAQFVAGGVPAWIPWHLFWAVFVGLALEASALSLAVNRVVRWSALLTGVMELLFVLMLHIPNAAAHPGDRFIWTVVLRDLTFSAGMFALAGTCRGWDGLVTAARYYMGAASIFFSVQHFLHPAFAPGVPLQKMTPDWAPVPAVWGWLIGLVLLAGGAALLANWRARETAGWLGLVITVLTAVLYLPMLLISTRIGGTGPQVEGLNYVFDTLLFAGSLLVLASALPGRRTAPAMVERPFVVMEESGN